MLVTSSMSFVVMASHNVPILSQTHSHIPSQVPSQIPSQNNTTVGGSCGVTVSDDSGSGTKAKWEVKTTEIFITICCSETTNGNKPGAHFSKIGWQNIIAKFNSVTGLNYTRKMLKNKWDAMRKEWGIWMKLTHGETGLGWDPEIGTVTASPDWWSQKLRVTPDAAKFRNKGPLLVYQQEMLFSNTVASGTGSWAPSSGIMPGHMEDNDVETFTDVLPQNNYRSDVQVDDINLTSDANHDDEQLLDVPSQVSSHRSRPFPPRSRANKTKKTTTSQIVAKCLQTMATKFDSMNPPACSCKNKAADDTMDACLNILDGLDGLDEGGEVWMYATRLFLKSNVRDLFLKIKTDRLRLMWLNNQMERDQMKRGGSCATSPSTSTRGFSYHNQNYSR